MRNEIAELVQTQIEERDGARWINGFCSICGTRLSVRASDRAGAVPTTECPTGHKVVVKDERSRGRDEPFVAPRAQ